jgi:large subunit ribosomal protein L7/L12
MTAGNVVAPNQPERWVRHWLRRIKDRMTANQVVQPVQQAGWANTYRERVNADEVSVPAEIVIARSDSVSRPSLHADLVPTTDYYIFCLDKAGQEMNDSVWNSVDEAVGVAWRSWGIPPEDWEVVDSPGLEGEAEVARGAQSSLMKSADLGEDAVDVVLTDAGPVKIEVIQAIRELTHLGLKEAWDLVNECPSHVAYGVSMNDAQSILQKLSSVGAAAEIVQPGGHAAGEH